MEKLVYGRTKGIMPDMVTEFCPGCMHSTVHKIIGEVAEEMGILDRMTRVEGVGCAGLGMNYVAYDNIVCAHGRAAAVATGVKRTTPDTVVYTYQGDGDLASIGLGETISAANRGEKFTTIFINNGIYGMTGGQMAPTTLIGMKATTAPSGRDPEKHGYPMHMCELMNGLVAPYYLVRVAVDTAKHVNEAKKAIKKAFTYQMEGRGYCLVEVVTSCPTNWGVTPKAGLDILRNQMFEEFPLGVVRDKGAEQKEEK